MISGANCYRCSGRSVQARRIYGEIYKPCGNRPHPYRPCHLRPQAGTAQVDLGAERLAALESTLARIEKGLKASQAASPEKHAYTVSEVAELTKLSDWTIRNACNKGRIKAQKGPDGQWRIARDELIKIQNEGLPK